MNFVIVLACLLVVAYANEEADVLKSDQEVNVDSFKYVLELSNSIKAQQSGHLEKEDLWMVEGEYEYTSKEGKHIKVTYTADKSGYHPKVEN